ncbi:MAG TPA: hypothetical protein VEC99_02170, partial [Clostridia bacterium]|nr:hypothetical protein [Clostridia bacterium]
MQCFLPSRSYRLSIWVGWLILLSWGPRGICAEESYVIKLDRPKPRVGQELQIKMGVQTEQTCTFDFGSGIQETNFTSGTDFLAQSRVMPDEGGAPVAEIKVEQLLERSGTNAEVLLPEGTIVIGKVIAGVPFYSSNERLISVRASKAIANLMRSGSGNLGCSIDQAFGTEKPRKVGETWSVQNACLTNAIGRYFETPNGVESIVTVKLLGVEEVE